MSWVISLILLAVAAYFVISALSSKNKYDVRNQATDGEVDDSESAQLAGDTTSSDAFQHAGGAPAGAGSSSGTSGSAGSGGSSVGGSVAGAAAVGATTAAAIASARKHNIKGVTGNSAGEIQEMLKILNLRDSDAARLAIEKAQFAELKSGTSKLGANELAAVADKLRWMLR
ncbi:MAG: hypothetical protein V3U65_11340 [Granulosicoccaceae bacterium]